jgi:CRP-like cAMP-binding protein
MIKGTSFSVFYRINMAFMRMITLILVSCLALHLFACLWCAIGGLEGNVPHTWIYREDLQDAENSVIYLTGVYYCLSALTTVGYGDVFAFTNEELIFSSIWMLFGVAFYSFTIGIISSFFQPKETKNSLLQKRMKKLEELSKSMNLDVALTEKLGDALTYCCDKISYQWLGEGLDIFGDLPIHVKYELLSTLHGDLIRECPFFNNYYDPNFTVRIVPLLKPVCFEPGEVIWSKNDFSEGIFFVVQGKVNFYIQVQDVVKVDAESMKIEGADSSRKIKRTNLTPFLASKKETPRNADAQGMRESFRGIDGSHFRDDLSGFGGNPHESGARVKQREVIDVIYKSMTNGAYFGDLDVIFRRRRNCVCKAISKCDAFLLSKTDFENVLRSEYPHIYKDLRGLAYHKEVEDQEFRAKCKDLFKHEKKSQDNESDSPEEFADDMAEYYENLEIDDLEEINQGSKERFPLQEILDDIDQGSSIFTESYLSDSYDE